jgi:hypothetical protein
MANFLITVDPDETRRARFLRAVAPQLAPVEGLVEGELTSGVVGIAWSASPRAPVDCYQAGDRAAVRWGIAVGDDGAEVSAGQLADWSGPVGPFDGFHALVRVKGDGGLEVSADVLGLYRLYYTYIEPEGVLLAGSSPRLFALHPSFRTDFDVGGLIGPLLFHFAFDERTIWSGVRCLAPGHVLAVGPGERAEQRRIYQAPHISSERVPGSLAEHSKALHRSWEQALLRQLGRADRVGILLSGGRDSRELAALLHANGVPTTALTLGNAWDLEARCASAVASRLEMPHVVQAIEEDRVPECARRQARWEHLSTGFGTAHNWDVISALRGLPERIVTGFMRGTREVRPHQEEFSAFFASQNRRGFPPVTIRDLLRPAGADELLASRLEEIRAAFESGGPNPPDRRWQFQLRHRMRFHSGAIAWRLSFGSWPIVPFLDRDFLAMLTRLPKASLQHRRAQDWALAHYYPELARLPMDRNDGTMDPVRLTPVPWVWRRLKKWSRRTVNLLAGGWARDPRYAHRMYDFDGAAWRAVRREAEPHRGLLEGICDPAMLDALWPAPQDAVGLDPFRQAYSRKLLVGLSLWFAEGEV